MSAAFAALITVRKRAARDGCFGSRGGFGSRALMASARASGCESPLDFDGKSLLPRLQCQPRDKALDLVRGNRVHIRSVNSTNHGCKLTAARGDEAAEIEDGGLRRLTVTMPAIPELVSNPRIGSQTPLNPMNSGFPSVRASIRFRHSDRQASRSPPDLVGSGGRDRPHDLDGRSTAPASGGPTACFRDKCAVVGGQGVSREYRGWSILPGIRTGLTGAVRLHFGGETD